MARKRASTLTTDDGPVFPLFNHLPWELRDMIWERALPPPTPQVMIYQPTTFPKWDSETNTWDATDGPPTICIPPPVLLHTTQESRAFALKHVLIRKVKKAPTRCTAPSAYHHIVSRPFNRDTDALFVHDRHFDDFVNMYKSARPEAARHLIFTPLAFVMRRFSWPLRWTYAWRDLMLVADRSCRGLRSVKMAFAGIIDGRLRKEAREEQDVRSYYRAIPDKKVVSWEEDICTQLAADIERIQVPGGAPWKVRVGGRRLQGADGGEDEEGVLEISQVAIQRFAASTIDQLVL